MSRLFLVSLVLSAAFLPVQAFAQTDNGEGFGYGAFMTHETIKDESANTITNKSTYHIVSQYDPVLKALLVKTSPELDENGNPIKKINLLPLNQQYMYFVRTPKTAPDEAILRLVTPVSIQGCANVVAPAVKLRKGGRMMAFTIDSGAVALEKEPVYAHFECHNNSSTASADLPIKRQDIIDNNITTITFQTGGGTSDTYNVEMKGDTLTLIPKTSFAFKPFAGSTKADPMSYTFYPENTIILYAPGAPLTDDITAEIVSLAQSKGLVESAELKNSRSLYFIDQGGTLASSLAFDANAYVGSVKAHETFQGANGSYEKEKQVDVYAKRPGLLD